MPRVSIGLPVYNGERYLSAAIDSLLAQSYRDFELIICDNASTDATGSICAAFSARDSRIRYLREPVNTGGIRNHNRTVELATGEYFKWAAHDDLYHPNFVDRCVRHLDTHPGTVIAYTRSRFIDEAGAPLADYPHPLNTALPDRVERFLAYVCANHIMVEDYGLMRLSVLRQTPLFGSFVWSDMVLFAELALHGPFDELPQVLFYRRDHPGRAMRLNRDSKSLGAWTTPGKSGGRRFPTWRVLQANLATLGRVSLSMDERRRLAVGICRRGWWTGNLGWELRQGLFR
jgi:glycosyltransferase involved in cell wall biosynthesis